MYVMYACSVRVTHINLVVLFGFNVTFNHLVIAGVWMQQGAERSLKYHAPDT